jgi:hypothetical protein
MEVQRLYSTPVRQAETEATSLGPTPGISRSFALHGQLAMLVDSAAWRQPLVADPSRFPTKTGDRCRAVRAKILTANVIQLALAAYKHLRKE